MFGVGCGRTGWSEKCPPLSDYGFDEEIFMNLWKKINWKKAGSFCNQISIVLQAVGWWFFFPVQQSGDRGDLASFPESGVDIYGGKTMGIFI